MLSLKTAVAANSTGGTTGKSGQNHQKGDVVTLTLQNREQFILPGEQKARFRNKWSMESVTNGISVSHDNPDKGQRIQAIPVETFMKVAAQISQGGPKR